MHRHRYQLLIAGVTLLVFACWLSMPSPAAVGPASTAAAAVATPDTKALAGSAAAKTSPTPASLPSPGDYKETVPHGTERLVTLPTGLASGIRCPDGTFLPLLNGVPHGGSITRDVRLSGPFPKVVAKRTEMDGTEWWIHADGSATTSRLVTMSRDGKASQVVVIDHLAPVRAKAN